MRLTKTSDSFGGMVWFRSQDRNDLWLEPCEMTAHDSRMAIDKLAAYEDAEEHGLLVRLPCKVGDTVYVEWSDGLEYDKSVVEKISIGADGQARFLIPAYLHSHSASWYQTSDFGKTVFLTREEAEAALKGETGDV